MEKKKPSWIPLAVFLISILVIGIAVIGIQSKYVRIAPERHLSRSIKETPKQQLTEISRTLNETATDINNLLGGSTAIFVILLAVGTAIGFAMMRINSNRF
jgi:uncharacterized membrane-anchored protein YhcB (DUF1043 family)